jgi:hypothetical protein
LANNSLRQPLVCVLAVCAFTGSGLEKIGFAGVLDRLTAVSASVGDVVCIRDYDIKVSKPFFHEACKLFMGEAFGIAALFAQQIGQVVLLTFSDKPSFIVADVLAVFGALVTRSADERNDLLSV